MAVLCIDTATDHGLIAVACDDGRIASVSWRSEGRHAENLLGYIESALAKASVSREEVSLIGVDIGPGGFTSVRVGLATAKGLALGLGLPIVGVTSLRVLARSASGDANTVRIPIMNAYRGDVFAAAYLLEDEGMRELIPAVFGPPESVFSEIRGAVGGRPIRLCGQGLRPHVELIESTLGVKVDEPLASTAAATPQGIVSEVRYVMRTDGPADLASLEPRYLRPSDAKLPAQPPRTDGAG